MHGFSWTHSTSPAPPHPPHWLEDSETTQPVLPVRTVTLLRFSGEQFSLIVSLEAAWCIEKQV
jgi:hypothetical protein